MKNNLVYRKVTASDALKLSVLYKTVYIQTYGKEGVSDEFANFITKQFAPERLTEIISKYPDNIITAEYKNNLVGVVEIEFNKKCPVGDLIGPELNKLYILDWFCGKGIGNSLLSAAEKVVLSKGYNEMWVWVYINNTRAISFYEKNQYEFIGNAFFLMEANKYENNVLMKKLY